MIVLSGLLLVFCFVRDVTGHVGTSGLSYAWEDSCAKPQHLVEKRQIPPLSESIKRETPQVTQTLVITRHGARTPFAKHKGCWEGYSNTWDCETIQEGTMFLSSVAEHKHQCTCRSDHTSARTKRSSSNRGSKSPNDISNSGALTDASNFKSDEQACDCRDKSFVFAKRYDAPMRQNVFGGTCQKGQLIDDGASQHQVLGKVLADAYFPGNITTPRVWEKPLVDFDAWKSTDAMEQFMYIRSTDTQRTRLSGINLVTSLINNAYNGGLRRTNLSPHPTMHTLDELSEYLYIKERHPDFEAAKKSKEFAELKRKHKPIVDNLREKLKTDIEEVWPEGFMDCMVVTACDEKRFKTELPAYLREHPEVMEAAFTAGVAEASFPFAYNNGSGSKSSAKLFMMELRRNILNGLCKGCSRTQMETVISRLKLNSVPTSEIDAILEMNSKPFMLWSAHDKTMLVFLGSIDGNVFDRSWPPYAAMVVIEIYQTKHHAAAFRFIYNSEDITHRFEGCHEGRVCSVAKFFDATNWVTSEL